MKRRCKGICITMIGILLILVTTGCKFPGDVTDKDKHTVSFNSSGGSTVASQEVEAGGLVTEPADPVKSGHTFGGWYEDEALTDSWNFSSDTVTTDITLYAKWTSTGLLSSLSADGHVVEPAFDPEVFEYEITVNYLVDEIHITAESLDEDDSVHFSKAQPMSLNVGNNVLTVRALYDDNGVGHFGPDYMVTVRREAMAFTSFLVEEYFEGTFPPENWSVVRNSGDADWLSSASTGYSNYTGGTGKFADANSDNAGSGTTMDTELRTPVLDLSSIGGRPGISFRSYFRNLGTSYGHFEVSTDGGTSWGNLITYSATKNDYVMILLDDYAAETNVMFRFHYTSTSWNWFWQIDDVKIGEVAED